MAFIEASLLASIFGSLCLAQADNTEISIHRYSALMINEIENIEHLYYNFQAKRVIESIPEAKYAPCTQQERSDRCLIFRFPFSVIGKNIFVKVSVGCSVFTAPTWQEVPFSRYQTSAILSTAGSDLRMSYTVINDRKPLSPLTIPGVRIQVPTTKTPYSVTKQSELMENMSWLEYYKIRTSKISLKAISKLKAEIAKNRDVKPYTKSIPTTTTITTTTDWRTTSSPDNKWKSPSRLSLADIREVFHLKSVDQVRRFILERSLIDRNTPLNYDVELLKDYIMDCHNVYRGKHEAPSVSYESSLERAAQRWADRLADRRGCLNHESPRIYGENLFFFGARNFPNPITMAKVVTQSFYMEGFGYNYNRYTPFSYFKTGHFTQLVWQKSRNIGIGVAIRAHNGQKTACMPAGANTFLIYVVVKYDPAGNFQTKDEYLGNVRPPVR